ncbi:TIGR02757 family protein [Paludibacter sp.]
MTHEHNVLFELLEDRYQKYNAKTFIDSDPVQIPHLFSKKEDIEISAFLSASIAWGQRKTIINNGYKLIKLMDSSPHDFTINAEDSDFEAFNQFTHRTFNGIDCIFFLKSLQNIYKKHGGLERVFTKGYEIDKTIYSSLKYFRQIFLETSHEKRSEKHLSSVEANSAAKRLNMFLRWLVRRDERGVDFGLWKNISASDLMIPLDVHVGKAGRSLGLLHRIQNDWTSVYELTSNLKLFDSNDPVKYDFALFSMSLNGELQ